MLTLLNGLALKYKIIGSAALIALALLGFRWWGNAQYAQGREAGRLSMSEDIADAVEAARREEREALRLERQAVNFEWESLSRAQEAFGQLRRTTEQSFTQTLNRIAVASREEIIRASQVSDTDLPDAIRVQLGVLRAGDTASGDGGTAGSPDTTD